MKRIRIWVWVAWLLALSIGSIGFTADFEDNGDGTVTDHATGLIWQQGESEMKDWETACAYCESLSLAGKNDWRLPNIKELKSIVDYDKYNPAINTAYFTDFPEVKHSYYWSSTAHSNMEGYAGAVLFFSGGVLYGCKSGDHFTRCVRGRE
ncbi:DUF1566 domain-containing protein [Thermodesulfobacteriota bacterium]